MDMILGITFIISFLMMALSAPLLFFNFDYEKFIERKYQSKGRDL